MASTYSAFSRSPRTASRKLHLGKSFLACGRHGGGMPANFREWRGSAVCPGLRAGGMSHGVPRLSRDGIILEPRLHPAGRAHVGDDLVFDLDHDLDDRSSDDRGRSRWNQLQDQGVRRPLDSRVGSSAMRLRPLPLALLALLLSACAIPSDPAGQPAATTSSPSAVSRAATARTSPAEDPAPPPGIIAPARRQPALPCGSAPSTAASSPWRSSGGDPRW